MGTLQEDCEAIGWLTRETEAAIAAGDLSTAGAKIAELHQRQAQGFVDHIRPDHPELDWDRIAGNVAGKGRQTRSGGKHEPTASDPQN